MSLERAMASVYNVSTVTLHVRKSNVAAIRLYSQTLGFETTGVDGKYYADGEDAFAMKKSIDL